MPRDWSVVSWRGDGQAEHAPPADAALPSVLGESGPPARMAYHPLERQTDPVGWAQERILFLGRDGRWRSLNLADLGLPEAWWPGPDTYGSGSLSADGRIWAAHTNAGIILVDLMTGKFRHVAFPRTSPMVRYVSWVPGHGVFSAYARKPAGSRYQTFEVTRLGRVTPVPYDGSRTRFDVDGNPVEIGTSGRTLTLTRWQEDGSSAVHWDLPTVFLRSAQFGVFGEDELALTQPTPAKRKAVTVWVLDKYTGHPQARLRVRMDSTIEGWTDGGAVIMFIDNRQLITWDPRDGQFQRLLDIPAPYPRRGEWAATTLSLPGL